MTSRCAHVAIVGSGPAGFFVFDRLQKKSRLLAVDMFERLPTPFGLVRGGVAPDHPHIKEVTRVFDRLAASPRFRFVGNVHVGVDVTHEELANHYDAIVYATGAPSDRHLAVPGEQLHGVYSAREFVGWYNAHPDQCERGFDLTNEVAVVVGMGNVALDVARILATPVELLKQTDIAPHALEALSSSRVRTIHVVGRRGPAQAAFTTAELSELGRLPGVAVHVRPDDVDQQATFAGDDSLDDRARSNLELLSSFAKCGPRANRKSIVLRFWLSPQEIGGRGRVESVRFACNRRARSGEGAQTLASGEGELLQCGAVFRSIGHVGTPLPGLPFDDVRGVVPNRSGRVVTPGDGPTVPGVYVAGWVKRGATGVIGTNKPDAFETADKLLEDLDGRPTRLLREPDELLEKLRDRAVSYDDWRHLDEVERRRGSPLGRPRLKFCRVDEMLSELRDMRREAVPP